MAVHRHAEANATLGGNKMLTLQANVAVKGTLQLLRRSPALVGIRARVMQAARAVLVSADDAA